MAAGLRHSVARRRVATESKDEAVELLFRRQYAVLVRVACAMVDTREAAEDAVQDAFISLYRHWDQLRDTQLAESYVRSAVLNRCRSGLRDIIRFRALTRRAAEQRAAGVLQLVERDDTDDDVWSLNGALRGLPRRQREVLACRYLLDLTVAETADTLGISEGAVKSHAHRGLHRLHEILEGAP
jgi:RNA polymerase sigma factor (sigma-70 family)